MGLSDRFSPAQVCSVQSRLHPIRPLGRRITQVSTWEIRSLHIGIVEDGPSEIRLGEIRLTQVLANVRGEGPVFRRFRHATNSQRQLLEVVATSLRQDAVAILFWHVLVVFQHGCLPRAPL